MEAGRIAVLDVLRGVAILGTLGTNVWVFMDPQGLLGLLTGSLDFGFDSFANSFATIWFFLSNGKSLALLTILFGVGVEIQRQSARRRGARAATCGARPCCCWTASCTTCW